MGYSATGRLEDLIDPDACGHAAREMADAVGDAFESHVRRLTPRDESPFRDPTRGVHIRDTIERTPVRERRSPAGTIYTGSVFTEHPSAPFLEWDTRAHDIRPREDRAAASVVATGRPRRMGDDPQAALAWRTSGGPGGLVFAHEVHHPGTRGAHMFSRGAAVTQAELDRICAPAMQRFERMLISTPTRPVR
jgi:hypothetical protein